MKHPIDPSADIPTSRSEKKRQAKNVEAVAAELVALPAADLARLPAAEPLKAEIRQARGLKAGAFKRQVKFIAKELRQMASLAEILAFLEKRRGSHLRESSEFHELERLREEIISEAIAAREEALARGGQLGEEWCSETIAAACRRFPSLEQREVLRSALRFAATRKPVHRREIFRRLQAAMERRRFAVPSSGEGGTEEKDVLLAASDGSDGSVRSVR